MIFTFKIGLLLGLSIIMSIGVQNLFVIKQGLKNEYPYISALSCFFCDFVLIILGVSGVSALLITFPTFKVAILILGVLFLTYYGGLSIKNSFNTKKMGASLQSLRQSTKDKASVLKLILLALSFSFLNPQAVLDTLVIIGGTANHYAGYAKLFFITGAISASLIWFFSLALASSRFSNQLMNYKFWRALEFISGIIMISIAGNFLLQLLDKWFTNFPITLVELGMTSYN